MKILEIKNVNSNFEEFVGKEVLLKGWVKALRRGKKNWFLSINDGSCFEQVQFFFPDHFLQDKKLEKIKFGSSILIRGIPKLTPERAQKFEVVVEEIVEIYPTNEKYPLQKQKLPLSFIREYPQFRARTNYFLATMRLRSEIDRSINRFFEEREFFHISTPIITGNDAEGGGEEFVIGKDNENRLFFGKKANLTVSGQLHAEALVQGLGKVYNFSPCFRAEKSNTTRHLSEFWMVEAEIAFAGIKEIIEISEGLVKYVIVEVLAKRQSELTYLAKWNNDNNLVDNLRRITKTKFPQVSYVECIQILKEKVNSSANFFERDEIFWGMDLGSEHEKYLANFFNMPVFIIDYPKNIKAFYMKENDDLKTVSCLDLIFPRVGEIIGGSVRENDYEKIKSRVQEENINHKELDWYLDLHANGYAPSSGFGVGIERLIMFISGSENIRDTIAFPRSFRELKN